MSLLKLCLALLVLLSFLQAAYAQVELHISLEKQVFFSGEEIEVEITAVNLGNSSVSANIEAVINSNSTYVSPEPCLQEIQLKPFSNTTLRCEWETGLVPGDYFIEVKETKTGTKAVENFKVEKKPIELLTCLDKNCKKQTSIFYLSEETCLSYLSYSNQSFEFLLVYPDNSTKAVKLPLCLKLERGTYELKAVSSSEEFSKKFAVISPFTFQQKAHVWLWIVATALLACFVYILIKWRVSCERSG